MNNISVTKELITKEGFETWFGFYGSIIQSEPRQEGKILYHAINPKGESRYVETIIPKMIFQQLAFVDLCLILTEARISGFQEIFELAEAHTTSALEMDFPFGYVKVNPETNEVSYKIVLIPRKYIQKLQSIGLEKLDADFAHWNSKKNSA